MMDGPMILPIVAFGHKTLREKAQPIEKDYPQIKEVIANMFETMYNAHGVGLAAPQINLSIRLFVVDGEPMSDAREGKEEDMTGFKKVFINPTMVSETGEEWGFDEGCLSIPDIRERVFRKETIQLRYLDEHFKEHTDTFSGMKARIIQHEYDHLEGVLFTDKVSPLRKQLLKNRLARITKGDIDRHYPMKFPSADRRK